MDASVAELRAGFEGFVLRFVESERFTGPSWYFHRKTRRRPAEHKTIATLLDDDTFFDNLYATLTAWGLHRMGPNNAKLRDLDHIRESVRDRARRFDRARQPVARVRSSCVYFAGALCEADGAAQHVRHTPAVCRGELSEFCSAIGDLLISKQTPND